MQSKKQCQGMARKLCQTFESYDMFSQTFSMRLDDGEDSQKSMTGALCSLLVFFIVLAYSYLKIDVLS